MQSDRFINPELRDNSAAQLSDLPVLYPKIARQVFRALASSDSPEDREMVVRAIDTLITLDPLQADSILATLTSDESEDVAEFATIQLEHLRSASVKGKAPTE